MPENIDAIVGAIAAVTGEVGSVEKRGNNEFHRYKYATASDILHKLQPVLAKHGLVIFQNERSRDFIEGGAVLVVTYEFVLAHKSGQVWPEKLIRTGMAAARTSKGAFDDKALNKCHTSAHKYFHLSLFEIPTGEYDDPDEDGDVPAAPKEKAAPKELAPPPPPLPLWKDMVATLDNAPDLARVDKIIRSKSWAADFATLTPDEKGAVDAAEKRARAELAALATPHDPATGEVKEPEPALPAPLATSPNRPLAPNKFGLDDEVPF